MGSVSIRFDSVLGDGERAEFAVLLTSNGARLATWRPRPEIGKTYARVDYDGGSPLGDVLSRLPAARVDDPPLCVLEISPSDPCVSARIAQALGGPGGPAGVLEARDCGASVIVELDDRQTPLSLVVDLIDLELATAAPGRRITPLLGLSDDSLAAFAAAALATPQIDRARIVETYTEPLLSGSSTCS